MSGYRWQLPDGVHEALPPRARALEQTRRRVLDVFHAWGFDLVEPPVVEYLDSLLVGGGDEVDLQTLKAVDQRSGRLLGVRADMTAQAVRIDAHSRPTEGVQRLCYAGPVVRANPASPLDPRVLHKAGAEIFGEVDVAADAEVIALMAAVLAETGVENPVLVLGHMGIYEGLVRTLDLPTVTRQALFNAVQAKSEADIALLLPPGRQREQLVRLPTLMGGADVLDAAASLLADAAVSVRDAVAALRRLAELVDQRVAGLTVRFDVAELAGYGYHNGAVFSVYHPEQGRALARGGRYDGIGADFGRARPATGFDVNLWQLMPNGTPAPGELVWVPWPLRNSGDPALAAYVQALRDQGSRVLNALSPGAQPEPGCTAQIMTTASGFALEALENRR